MPVNCVSAGQPMTSKTNPVHSHAAAGENRPAEQKQQHRASGEQAAPQVVENLPPLHQRQRILRRGPPAAGTRGNSQRKNLPIASGPAMLAAGICQITRRESIEQFDVGRQPATGVDFLRSNRG